MRDADFFRTSGEFLCDYEHRGTGDHIVCASALYGGTYNLYAHTIRKNGRRCYFCGSGLLLRKNLKAAFLETQKRYLESRSPILRLLFWIWKICKYGAHAHGVPFIVDNTFATPINCRPFEWGADIVTHSTTKYMDGHAACVGGRSLTVVILTGNAHADKFPGLTTPDETYHGIVYTEKFGKGAYITKATSQLDARPWFDSVSAECVSSESGIETLHLRMPRHCENALGGCYLFERIMKSCMGFLPVDAGRQILRSRAEIYAKWLRAGDHFRIERWKRRSG